jgi:PAS domain S-box-containing protein
MRSRVKEVSHNRLDVVQPIVRAAAFSTNSMDLFRSIRAVIRKTVPTDSLHIALYDPETELLSFPYFVDRFCRRPSPRKPDKGLTEYVLRTGRPLLAPPPVVKELIKRRKIKRPAKTACDWLGVPLRMNGKTVGVIAIQTYKKGIRYTNDDKNLLVLASTQVGLALERFRSAEAVKESEDRFRQLFAHPAGYNFLISPSGLILDLNDAARKALGYKKQELVQKPLKSIYAPESQPKLNRFFPRGKEPVTIIDDILVIRTKNGERRTVLVTFSPIKDRTGTVDHYLSVHKDITELKQAEQLLQESKQLFRCLTSTITDVIYRFDTRHQRYDFISLAAERMTGYPLEAFNADPTHFWRSLIHPDDRKRVEQEIERISKNPKGDTSYRLNYRIVRKDGSVLWVNEEGNCEVDESGAIISYNGAVRDTTERKKIEEVLRTSEEKYRTLTDNITVGVYRKTAGPHGKFITANPAIIAMFGYDNQEEFLASDIAELYLDPDDRAQLHAAIADKGYVRSKELHLKKKDGTMFLAWVSMVGVTDEPGQVRYYDGIIEDITERHRANERVAQERAQFKAILDALTDRVYIVNDRYELCYVNTALERTAGPIGDRKCYRYFHNRDSPCPWCYNTEIFAGSTVRREYRTVQGIVYDVFDTPIRDEDGGIAKLSFLHDITEIKQTEEALHRRDTILEAIAFAAQLLLVSTIGEDDIQMVLQILGSATEVSRVDISENRPAADGDRRTVQRYEWLAPGTTAPTGSPEFQNFSWQAMGFSRWQETISRGEIVWGLTKEFPEREQAALRVHDIKSIIIVPIFIEKTWWGFISLADCRIEREWTSVEREVLRMAASLIGAAVQRRQKEEELRRLVTAIEQTSEYIVITDPNGAIQYVNPAFERITGYTSAEAAGQNPRLLKSGTHDSEFYRKLWETIATGRVWHGNFVNRKKDGTLYEEEATISPVKNPAGTIINYVAIKRDVTDQRRLESIAEAVNLTDNIGYIFTSIRHELGNPLNSIKAGLNMLGRTIDSSPRETLRANFQKIFDEVNRVEYLLQAMKNFGMFEDLNLEPVELISFLEQFLSLLKNDFEKRSIQFNRRFAANEAWGSVDPRALHQVLLNLVTNAFDALEGKTAPEVTIGVAKSGGTIRLTIGDNGCGISQTHKQNLFKPFYTTKPNGTGLGLAIVKKTLAKMGGTIAIDSREAVGSIFTITLPEGQAKPVRGVIDR